MNERREKVETTKEENIQNKDMRGREADTAF